MKATLSNKTHLSAIGNTDRHIITKALTLPNPKHAEAIRAGRYAGAIPKTIELFETDGDTLILPRGVELPPLGIIPATVIDNRHSHPVVIDTIIETRPYQERALRLAMNSGGGVLVAPTGAGKTTMGIELAARLGQRCLILVKSKDLAQQWRGAIKRFTGLDCGLIGGGKWIEGDQFTVALVQTLVKHEGSLDYGMVIVDECHNVPAQQAYDVINRQAARYRFGLSATPQRRDDLEPMIFAALGSIVAEISAREVEGAVLPVTVKRFKRPFIGNPQSWAEFLAMLAKDHDRNAFIVSSAINASRTIGTVILTATIEHAETLAAMAKEYAADALLLHGQLPKAVRDDRMAKAHDANLIIGTLSLLSEGIDWPHIGAIVFGVPVSAAIDKDTPAAARLIQAIGRARRPFKGKRYAYVLDITDQHPLGRSAAYKRHIIYKNHGFREA